MLSYTFDLIPQHWLSFLVMIMMNGSYLIFFSTVSFVDALSFLAYAIFKFKTLWGYDCIQFLAVK